MDRTIPPGTPAGEDAGAVVGVVGRVSMARRNTTVKIKGNPGNKPRVDNTREAGRTVVPGGVREADRAERIARSSVGLAP